MLYLFLLWVARSALRDLRGARAVAPDSGGGRDPAPSPDATGLHSASSVGVASLADRAPRLVVDRAPGHDPG